MTITVIKRTSGPETPSKEWMEAYSLAPGGEAEITGERASAKFEKISYLNQRVSGPLVTGPKVA